MKKLLTFTFLLTVLVLLGACGGNSQQGRTPPPPVKKTKAMMAVDRGAVDLGTIPARKRNVRHVFTVKNEGTDPMVIHYVQITCNCTEADFTKAPIAPGETGEVKVTISAKELDPGQFRKTLFVHSNAQNSPFPLELLGVKRGK